MKLRIRLNRRHSTPTSSDQPGPSPLRRLGAFLLALTYRREPARQICPECGVDFIPLLTDDRCPICGWRAVQAGRRVRSRSLRVRQATGLGLVWFLGFIAFALVAHALYG